MFISRTEEVRARITVGGSTLLLIAIPRTAKIGIRVRRIGLGVELLGIALLACAAD